MNFDDIGRVWYVTSKNWLDFGHDRDHVTSGVQTSTQACLGAMHEAILKPSSEDPRQFVN